MKRLLFLPLIFITHLSLCQYNSHKLFGIDLNSDWYSLTNYQQLSYFLVDADTSNKDPYVTTDFEYSHDKINRSFLEIGFSELLLGFPRGMQTKLRGLQPELFLARKDYESKNEYRNQSSTDLVKIKKMVIQDFGEPNLNMEKENYSVFKWSGTNYQIVLTCNEEYLMTSLMYSKE